MQMNNNKKEKKIIGRAEIVRFPDLDERKVHARIDSGAKTSAIWGKARLENGVLLVDFFDLSDQTHKFTSYGETVVASSSGHAVKRFTIKLWVVLKGRKIHATFTIADRSSQVYPVLIGRNVLRGKFIVDVTMGKTLTMAEKNRTASLRTLLEKEKSL